MYLGEGPEIEDFFVRFNAWAADPKHVPKPADTMEQVSLGALGRLRDGHRKIPQRYRPAPWIKKLDQYERILDRCHLDDLSRSPDDYPDM
ncbi:hypothetical protein [Gluconobacter wancherniae]|uniref:hypothetical protein n=1 Tax=Gluconobacter wancherniae TaxID=1307955 RepID=UPI001B8C7335|nr:hypothetical protein [Gluconobacter wancherniae]MBS1088134.1 hypothetical protein [Gluconobacter wancherniae]